MFVIIILIFFKDYRQRTTVNSLFLFKVYFFKTTSQRDHELRGTTDPLRIGFTEFFKTTDNGLRTTVFSLRTTDYGQLSFLLGLRTTVNGQ